MSDEAPMPENDRCQYCGSAIKDDRDVSLDVKIMDPDDDVWRGNYARYLFCSPGCRNDAQHDPEWMVNDDVTHRETVHRSEVDEGGINA